MESYDIKDFRSEGKDPAKSGHPCLKQNTYVSKPVNFTNFITKLTF